MKIYFLRCASSVAILLLCTSYDLCRGSDHADPQSVTNPFYVQPEPNANITDLHAFIVDRLVGENNQVIEGEHLIVSLCVRRALTPEQARMLNFTGYQFRVHFDLDPKVEIFEDTNSRDPAYDKNRSMQALYGGIITNPGEIKENASLKFELNAKSEDDPQVRVTAKAEGFTAETNVASGPGDLRPNVINVQAGIFDDPFIFPRFFRRNVVGIVTAIPLSAVPLPHGKAPILLWATTHKGEKQIDHVGRSLRTQLPRFGYLNDKPPSEHVKEITRVHVSPTLREDILATFISPLEAHRHYDSVPDVMIYDLRKPAKFPNGRVVRDDVAKTLADAGETLLLELSYAESRQFPRAETNDKQFRDTFPYLAPPWTTKEIEDTKSPGKMIGSFQVPNAPEGSAIAFPNLKESTWRKMFALEVSAIVVLAVFALVFLWPVQRSQLAIIFTIGLAVVGALLLISLLAPTVTAIVVLAVLALVLLWSVGRSERPLFFTIALAVVGALFLMSLLTRNPTVTAIVALAVLALVLLWPVERSQRGIIFTIGLAVVGALFLMSLLTRKPTVTVIMVLAVLALVFLLPIERSQRAIIFTIGLAVVGTLFLMPLLDPNATMPPASMLQPGRKFRGSIIGLGFIVVLFTWAAIAFGVWWAERRRPCEPFPPGEQGLDAGEPTR